MIALLKKEISSFFSSPIGYLVIGVFLVLNGLFLFVFDGEFNILNNGLASLESFFFIAPWISIFLVPAVTMKSFSDEKKQGTLELLLTKPITPLKIVLGKYLGSLSLILLAVIPTLLYVYTISQLEGAAGSLDFGQTFGSYFGLFFLLASYTAIGIFTSSLSDNQIVAFILAVFISLLMYIGFDGLSSIESLGGMRLEQIGMAEHYRSISRGVIDTRDLIYFLSVSAMFIVLTRFNLDSN